MSLLQAGKPEQAFATIRAALAADPANPQLYNVLGLAASQLGRDKEAEASFRKVIQLSPAAAVGYVNLATLASHQGHQSEAADLFRAALKRDPHNSPALLGLGVTLARLKEYARAVRYLGPAWRTRPTDFEAGYEYARALRELKRPGEAQNVLERVTPPQDRAPTAKYYELSAAIAEDRANHAGAVRLYKLAYQLDPDSIDLYLALIRSYLEAGAGTGAAGGDQLASLPGPPAHLSPAQHFALGVLLASHEAYAEAIPHLEETLRLEPGSYATAFNLVLCYRGAGHAQAAIDQAQRTLQARPQAELYDVLASVQEQTGRYTEAAKSYRRALDLDPANEQYYFDLGTEYLAHFTFAPALEVFSLGSQKFPRSSRQYVGLGFALYAQAQYLEAAEAFLSALDIDPGSPSALRAWNSLPEFLTGVQWEALLPRLRRLSESHPQSAAALFCYGASLFHYQVAQGRHAFELPRSLLERALRLNPNLAEAHLELGNLYEARKAPEEAASELRDAVRLDPDSKAAHYRLAQVYRDLNQLDLAQQELGRYTELARRHREELTRSRSAIRQFVLTQSNSAPPMRAKPTE